MIFRYDILFFAHVGNNWSIRCSFPNIIFAMLRDNKPFEIITPEEHWSTLGKWITDC